MNLMDRLKKLKEDGNIIRVGLIGTGQMGASLIHIIDKVPGMEIKLICGTRGDKAKGVLLNAGIHKDDIIVSNSKDTVDGALKSGRFAVTEDYEAVTRSNYVDVVVDATGIVEAGANIAYQSIKNKKHVVMLNVEADVTFGNYLNRLAEENGVIYTGTAGDEPGAIAELINFARLSGLEVLVAGKGKNNPLDLWANPDTVAETAKIKGTSPKMLASFVDGTKTAIEMNAVANATGFCPDIFGMHGVESSVEELSKKFRLKSSGGILNGYGRVDYVRGIAPGVFIIVTSGDEEIIKLMKYLSMGDGPNYTLYRPYHLTSLETPRTIATAYLNKEAIIAPMGNTPFAETVAVAKKNILKGEYLDEIGEYSCYGAIDTYESAKNKRLVPIGLIDGKTKAVTDIKKDALITLDMIELDKNSAKFKLRKYQDDAI